MPDYFFDSSALVKRYVSEIGSEQIAAITYPSAMNTLHIARITIVEVVAVDMQSKGLQVKNPAI